MVRPPAVRILAPRVPGVSFLPGSALGVSDETFGERIRRLRTERGLTLVELAAAAGAAEGTIRQLESNRIKSPNFHLGLRLADQLKVDPHYLALGEGFSMSDRFDAIERRLKKLEQRLSTIPTTRR